MKESKLVTIIKTWLRDHQWYVVKYFGSGFSERGVPDLLGCYKGIFIGIEVKIGNNKPSEAQEYDLKQIKKCGGFSLVVNETSWKPLIKQLMESINALQ